MKISISTNASTPIPRKTTAHGKQEHHLNVENQKNEGNHIEARIELDARIANRIFAALIRDELLLHENFRVEQARHREVQRYENGTDEEENQYICEVKKHALPYISIGL